MLYKGLICNITSGPKIGGRSELPDNYFSPGIFVIEDDNQNNLNSSYDFRAVHNREVLSLSLTKYPSENVEEQLPPWIRSKTFNVQTNEFGQFFFRAYPIHWRYNKYIGKRKYLKKHNGLWVLKPLNNSKLNQVCIEHGFYFVGTTE